MNNNEAIPLSNANILVGGEADLEFGRCVFDEKSNKEEHFLPSK